ncbi:MAG: N-acetyltransferase family protein [Fimbriimonas sp.]
MNLQIRLATNADVPEVVRVIRAVYDEYGFSWDEADYHADLYDLEAHYGEAGEPFFVAEVDGVIVGTAALELFDRIPGQVGETVELGGFIRVAAADCSLERLYVHPDGRRGGVGRALLVRVIDEARDRGRTTMEMWSDKRFADAHRLYQKLGAIVVGERICDDPDVSPEWGLVLPLTPSALRETASANTGSAN